MKTSPLVSGIALLLIIALVFPPAFLLAPQKAHALFVPTWETNPVIIGDENVTAFKTTFMAIKETLIEIHSFTTKVATVAMWVNTFILQPLLFILSGRLLKSMTAGVLGFVTGLSNGAGRPQFVQNLSGNLQGVGDASAFAFFDSYIRNMGSPFASSIVSALRIDYVRTTSLAGFYAANRDTLTRTSPNINAYLAGDWSQGGLASWFALTTQDNNNPYMLYLNGQSQRNALVGPGVGGAKGRRQAELAWGNGMLSWCGTDASAPAVTGALNGERCHFNSDCASDYCGEQDGVQGFCVGDPNTKQSTIPGDACTNTDGTPGKVKTPGSVISGTLGKVLGATQDKIVQMGALASEVNGIMGDITRVMQTVNIAKQVLGGPDSGGLAGASVSSGAFLGVSAANVYQNAATSPLYTSNKSSTIDQYETAWLTIKSSADTALTSVNALASSCATSSAQTAITTEIQPVLSTVASATAVITAARAIIQKIQDELSSGADASADIQTLNSMPPTSTDLTSALQDSQTLGGATASPEGSLTVSGGSVVDRMNLIRVNATALKASPACTASSTP